MTDATHTPGPWLQPPPPAKDTDMFENSLYTHAGYVAATAVVLADIDTMRTNPVMTAGHAREMAALGVELVRLQQAPCYCRPVPEIEAFEADPGLARRLLDDGDFIASLVIRGAAEMLCAAQYRIAVELA
ncbi:MAG: hypothetical protein RL260_3137 [Pseudomonadota bacterium]|jgi:hypothetical protein